MPLIAVWGRSGCCLCCKTDNEKAREQAKQFEHFLLKICQIVDKVHTKVYYVNNNSGRADVFIMRRLVMNNASRMRIICDPFKKEIEYQWYDTNIEDYVPFDPENSKLTNEEYVNATIQNRAYEIVNIINCECNVGNVGLEIIFIGTEDDYVDLCNVINTYYEKAHIRCIRDECFYNTACTVMPKIKEKFTLLKNTFKEYTEEEIAKLVYKYNDAVKPSISLCVMGLYSAGKSAFINSIIGSEVLPSASDPTTARIYKINCDKKYQIRFEFDEKECVLDFKGKIYKPNSNFEKEIIKKLQGIIQSEGQHNEIVHMNKALDIINNYKNKEHKISDIIEVRLPYTRTGLPTDEFDFVIYDTPGSNSDNNIRHFEVLKDSLDEQTNALPIFVTTPDTMDAEDNEKILTLIKNTGASLDTTNAIIIINKSDEEDPDELKKKNEKSQELKITKWKSTRIFFVSSVIGIASKKQNPDNPEDWLSAKMFRLFRKNVTDFDSDGDMRLYEFNIVDQSKKVFHDLQSSADRLDVLYRNSGLESVEREIVEYAQKYALYNKCQQASVYLQDAIDLCVENVKEVEENLDRALQEAKDHFDTKKAELCCKLENKKKDIDGYNTEFQELMQKDFSNYIVKNHLSENMEGRQVLQAELQTEWKRLKEIEKKEKKDKNWKFSQIQQYVDKKYNDLLKTFSKIANKDIVEFWDQKSVLFKKECKKIVHDSDALTKEQKKILESIVLSKNNMPMYRMDFNLRQIGAIRHKKFLFWELKSERFDLRACCVQLVKRFNDAVRKRIHDSESTNKKSFEKWTDSLINTLTEELCKFNSDLNTFEQRITNLKADIESKGNCELMLTGSKAYIDELLDMQGGEGID